MKIRQFEDYQDIESIKEIVQDLSFSKNNLKEGFKDYPIENLDIFKDIIIKSPLSLGAFEDKKMLAFVVSYDINNLLKIENAKDPILQYLLQKQYLDNKSIYIDILGVIQNMQDKGISVKLLDELTSYIKQEEFKNIRCVVCLDSHPQDSSIYKILNYLGFQEFEKIQNGKGNNFAIYKLDI